MAAFELIGTVKEFNYLTPSVFVIGFEPSQLIHFKSGQFLSVIIPGAGPSGRDLRRAYSIASSPEMALIEICVKKVDGGPGTSYLCNLKIGEQVKLVAPYGDFVYRTDSSRNCVFISTGTGISPFRAMMISSAFKAAPPRQTICLLGVRTDDELLYPEIKNFPNVQYIGMVSKPKLDWPEKFTGRVTRYLTELPSHFSWLDTDFYLCGNGAMIKEVKEFLMSKGVQKSAIFLEKYY